MSCCNSPVADWKQVRDRELSEIITRRMAAGLLSSADLAEPVQRWIEEDLLPGVAVHLTQVDELVAAFRQAPAQDGKKGHAPSAGRLHPRLAQILERRTADLVDLAPEASLPPGSQTLLDAAAVAGFVNRWRSLGLLPPEAENLTKDNHHQLLEVLNQPAFQELAELLRARDFNGESKSLTEDDLAQLQQRWDEAGIMDQLKRQTGKPTNSSFRLTGEYLQELHAGLLYPPQDDPDQPRPALDSQARDDLLNAFRQRRVNALVQYFEACWPNGLIPKEVLKELATHRQAALSETRTEVLSAQSNVVLVLYAIILEALMREEVSVDLVGLALSGGGIRSASFNLGLLQALQQAGFLAFTDYLATVSGGGYVGSLVSSTTLRDDVQFDWRYADNPCQEKALSRQRHPERQEKADSGDAHTQPEDKAESKARKKMPLEPAPGGEQPARIVQLVRGGSYLNRPWLFASRYLIGLVLTNLVLATGLVAACALVALLWRLLDWPPFGEFLALESGGWIRDANRPFLPAAVLALSWLIAWAVSFRRLRPRPSWWITLGLLLVPVGIAAVLGRQLARIELPENPYPVDLDRLAPLPWHFLMLPLLLVLVAWVIGWGLSAIECHARLSRGWSATALLATTLAAGALGLMIWLGSPTINWANRLQLQDQPGTKNYSNWHRDLIPFLLALLVGGLLPALWVRRLVTRESAAKNTWTPLLLRIASWTMLIGVPLLIVFVLGQHNVSRAGGGNRDPFFTYTDFRDWNAFWDKVRKEHQQWTRAGQAAPHTPGSWIWEHLDPHVRDIVDHIDERRRTAEMQCLGDCDAYSMRGLILEGQVQNFDVPLGATDRCDREAVVRNLNDVIFNHLDFCLEFPIFAKPEFISVLAKNHPQWHHMEMGLLKAQQLRAAHNLSQVRTLAVGLAGGQSPAGALLLVQDARAPSFEETTDAAVWSRKHLHRLLLEAYFPYDLWERTVVHRTLMVRDELKMESPGVFLVEKDQHFRWLVFAAAFGVFLVFGCLVNLNRTSLHGIYKKLLARVYIEPLSPNADDVPLRLLNTAAKGGPYHLLGATLNKGWSQERFSHATTNFLFSQCYCGSTLTGYARTERYLDGKLDLGTAMAISGAAVSPARMSNPFVAFLMVILNLRLGQWLPSPRYPQRQRWLPVFRLGWNLLRHRSAPERRHWFISDGGHNENLGLGMLLRRECRLILISDAGYDPDFGFADFAQVYRRARLRGIRFYTLDHKKFISLDPLVPVNGISPHRFILARITYPGPEKKEGLLVYFKPSFAGDEEVDLKRYRSANRAFPHDPTSNQWFDEDQVESYRELGFWIGRQLTDKCLTGLGIQTTKNRQRALRDWRDRLRLRLNDLIKKWLRDAKPPARPESPAGEPQRSASPAGSGSSDGAGVATQNAP